MFKNKTRNTVWSILGLFFILIFSNSCTKTHLLTTGGTVRFSVDTLLFDTVFTAQGSATRSIQLFNTQKEDIKISSIRLEKGDQSPFRLNIDGLPGKSFKDIPVAGKDSLWIFAAVTIDPTAADAPFVVEDNLIVTLNNQDFKVPILAFGQNAHYIVDSVLETQTWLTDKPYIIIKNALVDLGATLTIPAGARVYMHQDSRLFVQGSLKITGTKTDSVIFQGDRIDRDIYVGPSREDVPGEWGGLYFFKESYNNDINYAVFKNGGASTSFFGSNVIAATIQVDQDTVLIANQYKLKITNSKIHTSQGYGIVAFGSSIYAENNLIVDCGAENVMLFEGGNYKFYNCTMASYGSDFLIRNNDNAVMGILNYYPISNTQHTGSNLTADIRNCIVDGNMENEIVVDKKSDYSAQVNLQNCMLKSKDAIGSFATQSNNIINQNPLFKDTKSLDFHLESGSPAIGSGIQIPNLTTDLDGNQRPNPPSIGCYEPQ